MNTKKVALYVFGGLAVAIVLVLLVAAPSVQTVSPRNARLLEIGPILAKKNVELATTKEKVVDLTARYHRLKNEIESLREEEVKLMNQNLEFKAPLPSLEPTSTPETTPATSPSPSPLGK